MGAVAGEHEPVNSLEGFILFPEVDREEDHLRGLAEPTATLLGRYRKKFRNLASDGAFKVKLTSLP